MILDKESIVQECRFNLHKNKQDVLGNCLFAACAVVNVLSDKGIKCLLQAGTCMWPRQDIDDGITPTHFSFVWEPDHPESRYAIRHNKMPELHVWNFLPHTREIIDITTGTLPALCKKLIGCNWPGKKPPDYFWQEAEIQDWPENVIYHAVPEAREFVIKYLEKIMKNDLDPTSKS